MKHITEQMKNIDVDAIQRVIYFLMDKGGYIDYWAEEIAELEKVMDIIYDSRRQIKQKF